MAITHPTDPRIKGLAAALLETDIPSWEFDLRAVEPGTDPPEVSDWHRRHGRANNRDGNIDKAAKELIDPVPRGAECLCDRCRGAMSNSR